MRTVNQILREERLRQAQSIADVEKKTKIKKRFLEAIEEGDYKILPSESYAVGFVKNYAKHLGLDDYKIGRMFRREYEEESQKILPAYANKQLSFIQRILFTPKFILVILLVVLIGGYLAFQYSSYFFPPQLVVLSPKQSEKINNNIVEIKGETDPYATLTINGDETYVNLDGTFEKSLYLFSGKREINITSENRYGKKNIKIINVEIP